MSAIVMLPTAANAPVRQPTDVAARRAYAALVNSQKFSFERRAPRPRYRDELLDFMGGPQIPRYYTRVAVVAALEKQFPKHIATIRAAVEGGDLNTLDEDLLQVVIDIRRLTKGEISRLWKLFPGNVNREARP